MDNGGFFSWLGSAVGTAIRAVVDALRYVFTGLSDAISAFLDGLSGAIGMSPTIFNYLWLALGVLLLLAAVRALLGRAVIAAIVWTVLAVLVLGSLMA